MMDSGGSTGRLRVELGTLPPGDVRKCLVALSDAPRDLLALFEHRFESSGHLSGHSLGNLMLSAAKSVAGGEYAAIELLERILLVRGHVYPVTLDDTQLVASLADGTEIVGEAAIDVRGEAWQTPIRAAPAAPGGSSSARRGRCSTPITSSSAPGISTPAWCRPWWSRECGRPWPRRGAAGRGSATSPTR